MKKVVSKRFGLTLLLPLLMLLVLLGAGLWSKRHDLRRSLERSTLPSPQAYQELTLPSAAPTAASPAATAPSAVPESPAALPAEVNLAVPFTAQAPHANWDPPYKEFCEEASVLMAISYLRQQTIASADSAAAAMRDIQAFEVAQFGYYEDTTAAETARILREYYDYDAVQLKDNPTVLDIKQALAQGRLVIVPAAGRLLGNPYFQQPGPLYHMFVVKGYTASGKFIVNDPGTRRGADFLYDAATVMNAMHDWRADGAIEQGKKVVIIVG